MAEAARVAFGDDGPGAMVSASRSVIYPDLLPREAWDAAGGAGDAERT